MPVGQSGHADAVYATLPDAVPSAHDTQKLAAALFWYDPAAHAMQVLRPGLGEKVPAPQPVHTTLAGCGA